MKVLVIARASFSHRGRVLGRAWICHMACWSGEPGQVVAHGTWCLVSAARHVNCNCLTATSSAPASPSVTSLLTPRGTILPLATTVSAVSPAPRAALAGSTRTCCPKTYRWSTPHTAKFGEGEMGGGETVMPHRPWKRGWFCYGCSDLPCSAQPGAPWRDTRLFFCPQFLMAAPLYSFVCRIF